LWVMPKEDLISWSRSGTNCKQQLKYFWEMKNIISNKNIPSEIPLHSFACLNCAPKICTKVWATCLTFWHFQTLTDREQKCHWKKDHQQQRDEYGQLGLHPDTFPQASRLAKVRNVAWAGSKTPVQKAFKHMLLIWTRLDQILEVKCGLMNWGLMNGCKIRPLHHSARSCF